MKEHHVPLLKDDTAASFLQTLEQSKIVPYTDEEREKTEEKLEKIFMEK